MQWLTVRTLAAVTVLALAGTAGCDRGSSGAQGQQAQQSPGGGGGFGGPRGAQRTATVELIPVVRGSIARQVTVSGVVEPVRTVGVNSQLAGAITTLNVQEGDIVRAGAVLAKLDDRELAAQVAAATAAHQVAEASYRRAEQLRDRRVITLPEYERERTAFAAAQAQVDQLRTRIGYATVTAPVSGVVTEKHAEAGDVVGNQARLFTIADISEIVVRVGVSELDVVELRPGDVAHITLDAFPNSALRGRIRRVFPVAEPQTRLVPVEVVFDAPSARLARPGFLARVTFDLATSENVLLLPVGAVLGAQGSQAVFLVEDGRAVRRQVTTGLTSQGRIEILSGLAEGEQVVVTGNNALREGMTVRTVGSGDTLPATQSATPADNGGSTPGPVPGLAPPPRPQPREGS
jgi:membrane fusion protein, multidrug efflux system